MDRRAGARHGRVADDSSALIFNLAPNIDPRGWPDSGYSGFGLCHSLAFSPLLISGRVIESVTVDVSLE